MGDQGFLAWEVLVIFVVAASAAFTAKRMRGATIARLLESSAHRQLKSDVIRMTREAEAFNSPSTFSTYAKMRREIDKKKAILDTAEQQQGTSNPVLNFVKIEDALRIIIMLVLSLTWGRTPIIYLPEAFLWPLSPTLTAWIWFLISYSTTAKILATI